MPHDHSHSHCGDDGHYHDIPEAQGHRDNLYTRIDRDNVIALNAANGNGPEVVKPWHERMDERVVRIAFKMLQLLCILLIRTVTVFRVGCR